MGCRCCIVRLGFSLVRPVPGSHSTLVVDLVVHHSNLLMESFWSLKESEAVELTFKKSNKGLESICVTGPGGVFCIGSERQPQRKNMEEHRPKGDSGGLDHHAKECKLPSGQEVPLLPEHEPYGGLALPVAPSSQGKANIFLGG
ncbi:protein lin-28 homolog A-like [Lepus europaeus]|uniref:protein lin-28 homolog A-like n=1 Tax=Lepus europaeus TaxID=9983 RepID=UPI002B4737C3|nr:protein lin-28 homolog A-like [Lepus europaeus]